MLLDVKFAEFFIIITLGFTYTLKELSFHLVKTIHYSVQWMQVFQSREHGDNFSSICKFSLNQALVSLKINVVTVSNELFENKDLFISSHQIIY